MRCHEKPYGVPRSRSSVCAAWLNSAAQHRRQLARQRHARAKGVWLPPVLLRQSDDVLKMLHAGAIRSCRDIMEVWPNE